MIKRNASQKLRMLAKGFPAIAVIGPRQSGKTTLVKAVFDNKPYVLLEDPETRLFAEHDPRAFLEQFPDGAILDEVQNVPSLFSYLQGILDEKDKPGMFILTGSQNFLLMEKITQSLAGRIAILKLLPLSLVELIASGISFDKYEECLFKGFYPRVYSQKIGPKDFYANYIQTYLERDLRLIKNVGDISLFHTFLKMCANRTGQLLNLSSLACACGINHNTAKSWISILETSSIIFLLPPHHKNFNKRLIKMPKLYFTDPGLAAYLINIENIEHLRNHPSKGALFETFIIGELLKQRFNSGRESNLYFWRDRVGHEIDCIIDQGIKLIPIEIKAGKTINEDYFKNLGYWNKLANQPKGLSVIVYGGDSNQKRTQGQVVAWKNINSFIS